LRRRRNSGFYLTYSDYSKILVKNFIFALKVLIAFALAIKFELNAEDLAEGSTAFATLSTAIRSSSL
jgi:hypothetical protein